VLASDAKINLAGRNKAALLIEKYGVKGFDYAGNAAPDLKIWPSTRSALIVNPHLGVERKARACSQVSQVFAEPKSLIKLLMRAIRTHQWLKNLLVFVPLLAAHAWLDPVSVKHAVLAFLAFSLCASSIYLVNDMLDLDSDRAHARKKTVLWRPVICLYSRRSG